MVHLFYFNEYTRHCEVRSNLYVGRSTVYVFSVQHRDCFVPRNNVMITGS